jgi:hypothetical protein
MGLWPMRFSISSTRLAGLLFGTFCPQYVPNTRDQQAKQHKKLKIERRRKNAQVKMRRSREMPKIRTAGKMPNVMASQEHNDPAQQTCDTQSNKLFHIKTLFKRPNFSILGFILSKKFVAKNPSSLAAEHFK